MTTKLRACIYRSKEVGPCDPEPWRIHAYTIMLADPILRSGWAASHPEAIQTAYNLMTELDQKLMTEVHESRASRRADRVNAIADEALKSHPPIIPVIHLAATHGKATA